LSIITYQNTPSGKTRLENTLITEFSVTIYNEDKYLPHGLKL